jgi:hypothetical protein
MNVLDILYTPLDVPPQPKYEITELRKWLSENYASLSRYKNVFAGTRNVAERVVENYPWDLTVAYFNMTDTGPGWLNNFDKKFPELSKYMYQAFGLPLEEVGLIIFLPMREKHKGLGFWHNDADISGLRIFFEIEDLERNKLYIRRMKVPYDTRPNIQLPMDEKKYLQDDMFECQILSSTQCHFLNNIRGAHATYTESQGTKRIAAFVTSKVENSQEFFKMVKPLILRSAEKYKDHIITWKPEVAPPEGFEPS